MTIDRKVLYERLMILFAAIVQLIGFVISITIEDFSKSFLPYFNVIVPVVNITCSAICFFLVFFQRFRLLQSLVLFVQGIIMTLNNIIFLGIYLYYFGIVLLFCNGYLKNNKTVKITVCLIPLFLSFIPISYTNIHTFYMTFAFSLFLCFSYFYIYVKTKQNLFELFPFLANKISSKQLPEAGSKLHLSEYGLTERQIKILIEFINDSENYKTISEHLILSISTVKQEMAAICKYFDVKNIEVLRLLLQQYELEN